MNLTKRKYIIANHINCRGEIITAYNLEEAATYYIQRYLIVKREGSIFSNKLYITDISEDSDFGYFYIREFKVSVTLEDTNSL